MGNNEFFYCYSAKLHSYLKANGQRYICAGLNDKTYKKFWQYRRSDELHSLLAEWAENKPTK